MNRARTRAKLTTAVGVLTLLFGAFLVVAPAASADPPGNNGTVKLDGLDLNDGPGHTGKPNDPDETDPDNDPHLKCGFQLEFFNFDTGEQADIDLHGCIRPPGTTASSSFEDML